VPRVQVHVQRDPPGGWAAKRAAQAELDRCFGRSENLSWLYADWMSSDYEEVCERWVIYQMMPAKFVIPDIARGLDGPNPQALGFWTKKTHYTASEMWLLKKTGKVPEQPARVWHSTAMPGVTHRKWHLWREFGCEAKLFWVVQGSAGGHKYKIKDVPEMHARELMGLPPDTPSVGELPYAPFDARVIQQLARLDAERFYVECSNLLQRTPHMLDEDEKAAARKVRKQLYQWWSEQVKESLDVLPSRWWAERRLDVPLNKANTLDPDIVQEEFITDQRVA
jgi:hypothetical protein